MKRLLLIVMFVMFVSSSAVFGNSYSLNPELKQEQAQITKVKSLNKSSVIVDPKTILNVTPQNTKEREYVIPADIKFSIDPTGHNESIKHKGRRFISLKDQTRFTDVLTVETAKIMIANNSSGAKVLITPKVKKGTYEPTTKLIICTDASKLPQGKYIEIAIANGQSKGKSNSAMLTAKSAIKGCALGAEYFVGFDADSERRFKHRGFGGGSGGADATNSPDTVLSGLISGHLGSSRYEQFPFQNGYLLRKVK